MFGFDEKSYITDYAKILYAKNRAECNDDLRNAIVAEFKLRNYSHAEDLASQMLAAGVIQTAHHQCPTNGAGFLTIDLISLCCLEHSEPYFVGTYSALPFSNNAISGGLVYKSSLLEDIIDKNSPEYNKILKNLAAAARDGATEARIGLLDPYHKDGLVYNSPILANTKAVLAALNPNIKDKLVSAASYNSYNQWCLDNCQGVQRQVFDRANIYYFDLCRIISSYLLADLQKSEPRSLISRLLLGIVKTEQTDLNLFVEEVEVKGRLKTKMVTLKNILDKSLAAEALIDYIKNAKLAPATFSAFSILAIENSFALIGSFLQYGYMSTIFEKYASIESNSNIAELQSLNRFGGGRLHFADYPLDFVSKNQWLNLDQYRSYKMEQFWQGIAIKS